MEQSFNLGDVVYLKSGGPNMTVKEFDKKHNEVICEWFNKEGDLIERGFHPDTLELYTPPTIRYGNYKSNNIY